MNMCNDQTQKDDVGDDDGILVLLQCQSHFALFPYQLALNVSAFYVKSDGTFISESASIKLSLEKNKRQTSLHSYVMHMTFCNKTK